MKPSDQVPLFPIGESLLPKEQAQSGLDRLKAFNALNATPHYHCAKCQGRECYWLGAARFCKACDHFEMFPCTPMNCGSS